jgi:hypothetical protein
MQRMTDALMLPRSTVDDIARRQGRGWYWSEKPKAAPCHDWQVSRIANYVAVMKVVPLYVEGTQSVSQRTRDAVWSHTCAEVDIRWRSEHPDKGQAASGYERQAVVDDPEVEAAFCAWAAYRVNGGDMKFADWRREWLTTTQEAKDGTYP